MPDATSIIATLAAIKHSIDVVKAVKDADYDLDKSILKEKIAVLVDSLLEAKIQAGETLDILEKKDKKIAELENILEFKSKLMRHQGKYYEFDENGNPKGDPFCSMCWDDEHKAIFLNHIRDNSFMCPKCKNIYGRTIYKSGSY
ncbi:MAG: hypothetical protein LH614_06345 [Pyrinomonadaceae bacterium]|nr:hypothetical protein [Pyrinomonadaceae bacterium]